MRLRFMSPLAVFSGAEGDKKMANELLNLAWPLQLESSGEKFVLVALADAANEMGWCSMCADTIAYRTGLHARTVKTLLRSICEKGLIYIAERAGRSSEFVVNRLALEGWKKAPVWLKNQMLKAERVESIKAQMKAAAPAPAPAPSAPAPAAPVDAATATLMMLDARTAKAAKPSPEIRAKMAALRNKTAAPAPAPAAQRNVIKLEDVPETELRGSS